MHKRFELKTGWKWNTQQTICEWEDITSKDFAGMASDYVDVIHLTQFRVQSEAVVKTAISTWFQQRASDYKIVMKDSDPCICTVVLLSRSYVMLCYVIICCV